MRKGVDDWPTEGEAAEIQADLEESSDTDWTDSYPSTTFRAVEPNAVTAGLDVTIYELDDADAPPMFELHQHYPEEDDEEGGSVYVHGEHAALSVIAGLSRALSERFEEVPWDDE